MHSNHTNIRTLTTHHTHTHSSHTPTRIRTPTSHTPTRIRTPTTHTPTHIHTPTTHTHHIHTHSNHTHTHPHTTTHICTQATHTHTHTHSNHTHTPTTTTHICTQATHTHTHTHSNHTHTYTNIPMTGTDDGRTKPEPRPSKKATRTSESKEDLCLVRAKLARKKLSTVVSGSRAITPPTCLISICTMYAANYRILVIDIYYLNLNLNLNSQECQILEILF